MSTDPLADTVLALLRNGWTPEAIEAEWDAHLRRLVDRPAPPVFYDQDEDRAERFERLHRCPSCSHRDVDVSCRCLIGDQHCRRCGQWFHVVGGVAVPGRGH